MLGVNSEDTNKHYSLKDENKAPIDYLIALKHYIYNLFVRKTKLNEIVVEYNIDCGPNERIDLQIWGVVCIDKVRHTTKENVSIRFYLLSMRHQVKGLFFNLQL